MALHQATGRWQIGLPLAITTAVFWATLPIAIRLVIEHVDVWTLIWSRFVVAAVMLAAWSAMRGGFAQFRTLSRSGWWLILLAAVMLIGNFVGYTIGLDYTTPANAQLLIQAAPLLMSIGGILVFHERFNAWQWAGVVAVAVGLALFAFDQSRHSSVPQQQYLIGAAIVLVSAVVWAVYALAQKQLLQHLGSGAVMMLIYAISALLLTPFASPKQLLGLDNMHMLALGYCLINTVAAYGAFAEALVHWEASRVGVVLAVTPLLTVISVELAHRLNPALVLAQKRSPRWVMSVPLWSSSARRWRACRGSKPAALINLGAQADSCAGAQKSGSI
ncbi:MAG: DMT family transporter [Rhodanobacteraceae bacterium]|nr:DMT family transporter [Rhodanobacteraceae bacterium]